MTELQDIYDVIQKYYHMNDMIRVDVLLATALSMSASKCSRLFMILVGSSGDWKSEGIRALHKCDNWMTSLNLTNTERESWVRSVDQLTRNTFVSGKAVERKVKNDLGAKMDGKNTLLLIYDFANLMSKTKDDKNEIFSQLRNLYDGFLQKDTGNGVEKIFTDCDVTLIAAATPMIKDEFFLNQALGTRELMCDTSDKFTFKIQKEERHAKATAAFENQAIIEKARKELKEVFEDFLIHHPYTELSDDKISKEMKNFIIDQACLLATLRATVKIDFYRYDVIAAPVIEEPTRLTHQLKLLYKALKSLGADYSDERCKAVIKRIVKSSAPLLRYALYLELQKYPDVEYTAADLADKFEISYRSVRLDLDILCGLKLATRIRCENQSNNFEVKYLYRFNTKYFED